MRPLSLRRRVRFVPRLVLVLGILIALPALACMGAAFDAALNKKDRDAQFVGFLMLAIGLAAIIVIAWAAWALLHLDRNRDVRQLTRFGDPLTVLAGIDAELSDLRHLFAIGYPQKIFSLRLGMPELHGPAALLLTRSWLVYTWGSWGHRFSCLQLADLVVVYRAEATILNAPVASAIFIDRDNVKIEVPGGVAPITRLLAEVLLRVPWALNRFDPATERTWQENREQIIAEADVRRQKMEEGSGSQPGPPTDAAIRPKRTT
jgi:hypothetical protein